MKETIAISIITSVLTSGALSTLAVYYFEHKRRKREEKNKRAEELFLLAMKASNVNREAIRACINYGSSMISENDFLNAVKKYQERSSNRPLKKWPLM